MKRLFFILSLLFGGLLAAREVKLENVVCNPGAYVVVPVTLDEAQGLAVVSFTLTYDPQVLVLHEVRQGALRQHFSYEFVVEEDTGAVEVVSVAPDNIADSCSGTLAEVAFYVREGSDSLYSDLALADVSFNEETMTLDMSSEEPTTLQQGLIRPLATTNVCQDRMGEGCVTVAAETTLKSLALLEGDALAVATADAEPILVTESFTATGALDVVPPVNGWATATYPVLKCKATNVRFNILGDATSASIVTTQDGGYTLYSVAAVTESDWAIETTPSEWELSADDKNALVQLLNPEEGVKTIRVAGTQEAVEMGLDLGILPQTVVADGVMTANFAVPTLEIVGFDVAAGKVTAKVVPPEGATLGTLKPVTGVIHLYGTDDLSVAMEEMNDLTVSVEDYTKVDTRGHLVLTVQFGTKTFFRVVAGRTSATTLEPATKVETQE